MCVLDGLLHSTNRSSRLSATSPKRRRIDEAPGKRATEQDRHPNAAASASAQHEDDVGSHREEGAQAEEGKVAEEDEDSEPSDDEDNK